MLHLDPFLSDDNTRPSPQRHLLLYYIQAQQEVLKLVLRLVLAQAQVQAPPLGLLGSAEELRAIYPPLYLWHQLF